MGHLYLISHLAAKSLQKYIYLTHYRQRRRGLIEMVYVDPKHNVAAKRHK
jgi:hypothetical protein